MKNPIMLVVIMSMSLLTIGQNEIYSNKKNPGYLIVENHFQGVDAERVSCHQTHLFRRTKIFLQSKHMNSPLENKQRLDSIVTIEWDEPAGQWYPNWKDDFTYDIHGGIIISIGYGWDETNNQLEKSEKNDYSYDAGGNISQIITFDWDENTSQWVEEWKEEFIYDANERLIQSIDYHPGIEGWVYTHKYEYNYDVGGNLVQLNHYGWDVFDSEWIHDWKEEYTYNTDDKILEELFYDWEGNTSQWVPNYKSEYTYDDLDYLVQIIYYNWNETNSEWTASEKDELFYDSAGNLSLYIYYWWNESISEWEHWLKEEYIHDNSFAFSNLILPYYHEGVSMYFNHKLDSFTLFGWDDDNSEWIEGYISDFHYSEQNVGSVGGTAKEAPLVFPNPVFDRLTIKAVSPIDQLELYNQTGQLIKTAGASGNMLNMDVSDLKTGIYIIKVYFHETIITRKLVIE